MSKKNLKTLLIIIPFFIISCSNLTKSSDSALTRSPSSEDDKQCQTSLISHFSEQEHQLCSWAQDYLRQLSQTSIQLQMSTSNQSNGSKRKIITLSAQLSKVEIDQILGRGGLRIRYIRYLLNELSHHQALTKAEENAKKDVIANFPLVELILEPQD